jgi:hypothetical protein
MFELLLYCHIGDVPQRRRRMPRPVRGCTAAPAWAARAAAADACVK